MVREVVKPDKIPMFTDPSADKRMFSVFMSPCTIPNFFCKCTVGVTQIDILEEHHLFMILSNGTLSSYPLEVLNASGDQDLVSCEPQKVQDYVDFFKIGISVGRHLVCSVNTSESSTEIRVFQPSDISNQNGMRLALDSMGRRNGNTLNLFKVSNSFFYLTKPTI